MVVGGTLKQRYFSQRQRAPQIIIGKKSSCAAVMAIGCSKVSKALFRSGAARCGVVSWVIVTQTCDNGARRFKLLGDFSVALCRIAFSLTVSKVSGFTF